MHYLIMIVYNVMIDYMYISIFVNYDVRIVCS